KKSTTELFGARGEVRCHVASLPVFNQQNQVSLSSSRDKFSRIRISGPKLLIRATENPLHNIETNTR
ncbi:hypothetical protein LOAG_18739, partial [Loa loa]